LIKPMLRVCCILYFDKMHGIYHFLRVSGNAGDPREMRVSWKVCKATVTHLIGAMVRI
jgi:hypothetical protein